MDLLLRWRWQNCRLRIQYFQQEYFWLLLKIDDSIKHYKELFGQFYKHETPNEMAEAFLESLFLAQVILFDLIISFQTILSNLPKNYCGQFHRHRTKWPSSVGMLLASTLGPVITSSLSAWSSLNLTAHAWVSGPDLAPQKFLLSQ